MRVTANQGLTSAGGGVQLSRGEKRKVFAMGPVCWVKAAVFAGFIYAPAAILAECRATVQRWRRAYRPEQVTSSLIQLKDSGDAHRQSCPFP